jgi:hypothetical protein
VEAKIDPKIVVLMQYWLEAGTDALAAMAQIGRAIEITMETAMRTARKMLLLCLRT